MWVCADLSGCVFFFLGGVGGCGFVPVLVVGVVAAMVVGGYCCGNGGYASIVVDDDGDDSDRDRENVIYYFNV